MVANYLSVLKCLILSACISTAVFRTERGTAKRNKTLLVFRLFESLCSSDSSNQYPSELRAPDDDDDECRSGLSSVASLVGSRTSSQWSLVKGGGELDEDDIVSISAMPVQSSLS